MKIAVGCDHAAFNLKAAVVRFVEAAGYDVLDFGTDDETSVDYPAFAAAVASAVAAGEVGMGILLCATGIGMSMAANKVRGVRAALCHEAFTARMSRAHNDANVLCLGARVVGEGLALETVHAFLTSQFEGGRHARRVEQIMALESADEDLPGNAPGS